MHEIDKFIKYYTMVLNPQLKSLRKIKNCQNTLLCPRHIDLRKCVFKELSCISITTNSLNIIN